MICTGEVEYLESVVVGKSCSLRRNCFHFGHGFLRGEAYVDLISSGFSGSFEAQAGRPLRQTRLKLQG
jgi:hypothetical protein